MSVRSRDVITTVVRIVTFIVTMIPLAALFMLWATLDGSVGTRSGVGCIALLASPVREYLLAVDLVQAAVVTSWSGSDLAPVCSHGQLLL